MNRREYERLFRAEEEMWWFRAMHLFLQKILRVYLGDQSFILDVGCGTGGLIKAIGEKGHRVVGLDYSAVALDMSKRRPNFGLLRANGNAIPFRNKFDFVFSIDLLEISDINPRSLVQGALGSLKPDGYAVFVAAAHQWLLSEHDRAVNSTRRYNLTELRSLFSGPDVKILRSTYLYLFLFPLVALRKLLNPQRTEPIEETNSDVALYPTVLNAALYAICWFEAQLLDIFDMPIGSSVLILVQKNG